MQETYQGVVLRLPILTHIQLDFCWVCKAKGLEAKLHSHHVIPTAFGGRDGPQVTVCSSHHNSLHDAAKLMLKPDGHALVLDRYSKLNLTASEFERFMYLVVMVYRADMASKDSKNKTLGNMNRKSHTKLVALSKYLNVSQKAAIDKAIDALHLQIFGN